MALVCVCSVPNVTGRAMAPVASGIGNTVDPKGRDALTEYKIKAAFLYNFIRYTSWPKEVFENDKQAIEVLVVGTDPFQGTLEKTFAGKTLHGRKIVVRRSPLLPKEINSQLVFASNLTEKENVALLKLCQRKGTFLIGDWKGYAEQGACANFYVEDRKVRFQVNTDVVKARGLEISSQLLKLAIIVKSASRAADITSSGGAKR